MTVPPRHIAAIAWFRALIVAVLAVCVILFVARTWHWPLVNDAAQIDYVCFLMDHGMAPYRDIVEMNMPGIYLVNWTVLHTLGGGSLAWRIFDLGLLCAGTGAIMAIARPYGWFAGVYASALFALFHGRDGVEQMGQRDMIIAVLLLGACAFLFHAVRVLDRRDPKPTDSAGGIVDSEPAESFATEQTASSSIIEAVGAHETGAAISMALFGICAGAAGTIKPTPLPFALLLLLIALIVLRKRKQCLEQKPNLRGVVEMVRGGFFLRKKPLADNASHYTNSAFAIGPLVASALAGMMVPLGVVLVFLLRKHALLAFLQMEREMLPYYATLGRISATHLVIWMLPPSLRGLGLLALLVFLAGHDWSRGLASNVHQFFTGRDWEQVVLVVGIGFGMASYIAQGKGFAYHRYPMVGFLLCWAGIKFATALGNPGTVRPRLVRSLGVAGLVFGAVLAPLYLAKASRLVWNQQFTDTLQADLNSLGGSALSTHVQCIYTFSECDTTLYRMGLVQSTGLFYDYFLFGPEGNGVIQRERSRFSREIEQDPPKVFVVVAGLYPNGPAGYGKLRMWPWFDQFLAANYSIHTERRPYTGADVPLGYRIYLRNDSGMTRSKRGPDDPRHLGRLRASNISSTDSFGGALRPGLWAKSKIGNLATPSLAATHCKVVRSTPMP